MDIKIKSERNYGIDLLRSISMLMVIMLHTLARSGLLTETAPLSARYEFSWLLEIMSYCAVDCFIIISGYVGLNSKFHLSRIIKLWVQVVFFLVFSELVFQFHSVSNGESFDYNALLNCFLPISNNEYWFFTQYFALSFLMPFINKALKSWTSSYCVTLSVILFILFSVWPTAVCSPLMYIGTKTKMDLFLTDRGYSVLWFIVLYIFGCTIKKVFEEKELRMKQCWSLCIYAVCVLIVWGVKYYCDSHEPKLSANFMVAYTGIFVVISAVSLVLFFESARIGKTASHIIKYITPNVFAVYLANSCPRLYQPYIDGVLPLLKFSPLKMVVCLFSIVIGFFIAAIVFDKLRNLLFEITGINNLIKKVDNTFINKFFI